MAQKIVGYREMMWTCPNCGAANPGSVKICKTCGASMDEETKFEQASNAQVIKDEKVIERAKKGPDVYCAFCGTRNPAGSVKCSQCGGDLSEGHERQHGQQYQVRKPDAESAKPIICPACGGENPAGSTVCRSCGNPLTASKVETIERTPVQPAASEAGKQSAGKGCSRGCLIPIIIIAAFALFAVLFMSCGKSGSDTPSVNEPVFDIPNNMYEVTVPPSTGPSNNTNYNTVNYVDAYVTSTSWETSVEIIGDVGASGSAWEDQVPYGARDVSCSSKLFETYDDEVPGSVEKCGEVYSVDLGNGYEALTQDCVYEVYKDYCTYTVSKEGVIETKRNSGTNSGPSFAYVDTTRYKTGNKSVTMEITVKDETGKVYRFEPSSVQEFTSVHPGDVYQLEIRNGQVVNEARK